MGALQRPTAGPVARGRQHPPDAPTVLLAVETERLTRWYGPVCAVDGLDLAVPAGSVYGFLGPNGAGKTTTLRALLGLVTPTAGAVRLFGETFDARSRSRLLSRTGALIEEPSLYRHLTGRDNLEATRRLRRLPKSVVGRCLDVVGLSGPDADRRVRAYSQGMRQRLGLALALLASPDLLILDEPANGLDPEGLHDLRDVLTRLHQEAKTTVLVSSHQLGEVERVATHVGVVRAGRLVRQGPLMDLLRGTPGTVRLRVSDAEEAAAALSRSEIGARTSGGEVTLSGPSSDEAVAAAVRAVVGAGVDVYGVDVRTPSLEALFFSATSGRTPLSAEPVSG